MAFVYFRARPLICSTAAGARRSNFCAARIQEVQASYRRGAPTPAGVPAGAASSSPGVGAGGVAGGGAGGVSSGGPMVGLWGDTSTESGRKQLQQVCLWMDKNISVVILGGGRREREV